MNEAAINKITEVLDQYVSDIRHGVYKSAAIDEFVAGKISALRWVLRNCQEPTPQ
jgi:hypothetical protein